MQLSNYTSKYKNQLTIMQGYCYHFNRCRLSEDCNCLLNLSSNSKIKKEQTASKLFIA